MNPTMEDVNLAIAVIVGAFAVIAGIYAFLRWAYRAFSWTWRTLEDIKRVSHSAHAELKHNGGKSMRDDLSRLADQVEGLTNKLDRMELDKDTTHTALWQAVTTLTEQFRDILGVFGNQPGGRRKTDPPLHGQPQPDDEFPT